MNTYAPTGGSRVFNCDNQAGAMTAFDAANGQVAWSTEDECGFDYSWPAAGTLIAADSTAVYGLDPTTGATLWQTTAPLQGPSTDGATALGSDVLRAPIPHVFAQGSSAYYVWNGTNIGAYQAGAEARALWTAAFSPDGFAENITVTFDGNDTMFIGSGSLFAVDTRTGGCRWRYTAPARTIESGSMSDTPTAVGGGLCFVVASAQPADAIIALAVE